MFTIGTWMAAAHRMRLKHSRTHRSCDWVIFACCRKAVTRGDRLRYAARAFGHQSVAGSGFVELNISETDATRFV